MIYQRFINEQWSNSTKYTNSYNNESLVDEYVTYNWDETIGNWNPVKKTSYTYNDSGIEETFTLYAYDVVNGWGKIVTCTGEFNTMGLPIRYYYYHQFPGAAYSYEEYVRSYSYDGSNNCKQITSYHITYYRPSMVVTMPLTMRLKVYFNDRNNFVEFTCCTVTVEYQTITNIKDEQNGLTNYKLYSNYPNPFNPNTTITFDLPIKEKVSLKIYDILGNEIATLFDEELSQGTHSKQWVANNLSSGIYFYTLKTPSFTSTKKMILIK